MSTTAATSPGQPAAVPVMIFNLIPFGSSPDTVTALILICFAWSQHPHHELHQEHHGGNLPGQPAALR